MNAQCHGCEQYQWNDHCDQRSYQNSLDETANHPGIVLSGWRLCNDRYRGVSLYDRDGHVWAAVDKKPLHKREGLGLGSLSISVTPASG